MSATKNKSSIDNIYRDDQGPNPFKFDNRVTQVFDDMVRRSIPNYEKNRQTMVTMAMQYSRPKTVCYDLGCSLGKLSIELSQAPIQSDKIIAMDNSCDMLDAAKQNLEKYKLKTPIELLNANLDQPEVHDMIAQRPSSVVILNYTLQFLSLQNRLRLLQKIKHSLIPNGILILCEKVRPETQTAQQLFDKLYDDFKRQKGYHNLEISRKREALENILISEHIAEHQQRLRDAGFQSYEIWHKHWHFTSWIAWA